MLQDAFENDGFIVDEDAEEEGELEKAEAVSQPGRLPNTRCLLSPVPCWIPHLSPIDYAAG